MISAACEGSTGRSQFCDGRALKELLRRELQTSFVDLDADLNSFHRVAAQFEGVVVNTDLFDAEHVLPDRCQSLLDIVARRNVGCLQIRRTWMHRSRHRRAISYTGEIRLREVIDLLDRGS